MRWMILAKYKINCIALGKKFKTGRENLNLTQSALAEEVEVSTNFIGQLERGERVPSLYTTVRLANKLSLSLDSLLAESLTYNVAEEKELYLTDKQKAVLSSIVKTIKDNF